MAQKTDKLELLDKILGRNLSWISSADSKIAPILGIDTAMLGVIAAMLPRSIDWLAIPAIVTALAALLLLASIICLVFANFPRLQGPKGSLIFFGGIASLERNTFVNRITSATDDELIEDFGNQIHRNAEIAQTKYSFVKWAMILLFSAILPFLISIGFLYQQLI